MLQYIRIFHCNHMTQEDEKDIRAELEQIRKKHPETDAVTPEVTQSSDVTRRHLDKLVERADRDGLLPEAPDSSDAEEAEG